MKRSYVAVLLVILLGAAASAWAMDKPTITAPVEGAALGPNFDISGSMPAKAFLVVITDCIRSDTGELVRSVPGIRRWTKANGTFQFRCASPRIADDSSIPMEYRVRCFATNAKGEKGPEAVVTCRKE